MVLVAAVAYLLRQTCYVGAEEADARTETWPPELEYWLCHLVSPPTFLGFLTWTRVTVVIPFQGVERMR